MLESWKASLATNWPNRRCEAAVALADALNVQATIDDALWDQLRSLFNVEEILELVFLVGHYTTTAYALNALRAS